MSVKTDWIVLDRDGVINEDSDAYIKTVDEWLPIEGSLEAIARLTKTGIKVAVATNQSGIGRGYYTEQTLHDMHRKMSALLIPLGGKVNLIVYCPHEPSAGCACRKPADGLIRQIETVAGDLTGAWMIGDSLRDLKAGLNRGMTPVLVKTGKGEKTLAEKALPDGTLVFGDLAAAVDDFLERRGLSTGCESRL